MTEQHNYKIGDRVRVSFEGEVTDVLEFRVEIKGPSNIGISAYDADGDFWLTPGDGWSVERAAIVLPAVPGSVILASDGIDEMFCHLSEDGDWIDRYGNPNKAEVFDLRNVEIIFDAGQVV